LGALNEAGPLSLVHSDLHSLVNGKLLKQTVWDLEGRSFDSLSTFDLLVRNVVTGCTLLMDAELARRFPVIPEGAAHHDHWYAIVASKIGRIVSLPVPLMAYRQHGQNVVGVQEFKGFLSAPQQDSLRAVVSATVRGWVMSRSLAQAAWGQGLKLTAVERLAFLGRWDFGGMLFLHGVRKLASSPAVARASIIRGLGKLTGLVLFRQFALK
jgi:hypothetical protein